ncbi:MAG: TonB-dependent receptor, partial [Acidobacteriaceae bacterium]|nr:TonB-dependent receptor [Acidobacteriaceae bacterium]
KAGDFSQTFNPDGTLQQIFDPFSAQPGTNASGGADVVRTAYPGNKIPAAEFNPIAVKILALYPNPTGPGDPVTGANNFSKNYLLGQPAHQYNLKLDYLLNDSNRFSGRFSKGYLRRQSPTDFQGAIGQGDEHNDYYNDVLEYTWTASPTLTWLNRLSVDRHHQTRFPDNNISPTSVGFPSILETANGSDVFPQINVQNYQSLGLTGYTQTIEAQTEWVIDSSVSKIVGPHNFQFGGESRILLSNFFQPPNPSGAFNFSQNSTMQYSLTPDSAQGNGIASLLTGWAGSGDLSIHPSVAEKSRETSFFFQDDWAVTKRLTLNLGLRYEFSTPYEDRYNRLQIANFTADTGVNVPGIGEIRGVDEFVTSGNRHSNTDWNNFGPRLGAAFQLTPKTVIRGGAGLYYGVNYATSYQDLGPAFRGDLPYLSSLDNGLTQYATLANPFPFGNVGAQGRTYGKLADWGFSSTSNQSNTFRNAEIYQFAFSVQHELPWHQMVEVAYSGNRSTHLPDAYVRNRNYISAALREQYGSSGLYAYVPNPFYSLFVGPNAIFNEPDSVYAQPTTQQINLLRPFPQFPGPFEGYAEFVANSWYNAFQLKYEKRYSSGLNIVGSYTLAKLIDDGSASSNGWLGNAPSIQDFNNLRGEYSVGATDARHRVVLSGSYELPFGRGKQFGHNLNAVIDAVLGNWQINAYFTYQSGLPMNIYMTNGTIADGNQRPNVTGNPRSQYSLQQVVASGGALNFFNVSSFSNPGDEMDGNEPRFNDALRGDGIRDLDFSIFKNFSFRERYRLQLRAEFFNFTNTPRFTDPDTGFGDTNFGVITSQANQPRQAQMGARLTF